MKFTIFRSRYWVLAVVLVSVLTFVSCGNDSNDYDRTIEELFNRVKSESRYSLVAITSAAEIFDYCSTHQRWEGLSDHTPTPDFKLADAVALQGFYYATTPTGTYIPSIGRMLPILNSFFDAKYKTNQPQYNPFTSTSLPNGTTVYGWFVFTLSRNGNGSFGGTTQTVQAPLMADRYYF